MSEKKGVAGRITNSSVDVMKKKSQTQNREMLIGGEGPKDEGGEDYHGLVV